MFKLLKHPNSNDIAMEVLKRYYIPEKDVYKLKIMWWNIGRCHKPWPMGIEQKLTLPASKFKEWRSMSFGKLEDAMQSTVFRIKPDGTGYHWPVSNITGQPIPEGRELSSDASATEGTRTTEGEESK